MVETTATSRSSMVEADFQYVYHKLANPHRQIRLLSIKGSPDVNSVIVGEMIETTVEITSGSRASKILAYARIPTYIALSHVWGSGADLEKTREIYVDGRRMMVTENIFAAIHCIRARFHPKTVNLWIDSIGINQADDDEKSAQVPLMRQIYHTAMIVIIWLGQGTEEAARAADFVLRVLKSGYTRKVSELKIQLRESKSEGKYRKVSFNQWAKEKSQQVALNTLTSGAVATLNLLELGRDVIVAPDRIKFEDSSGVEALSSLDLTSPDEDTKSWSPDSKGLEYLETQDHSEMMRILVKSFLTETQYFERMWTLQEACVANFTACLRGFSSIHLDDLLACIYYLATKRHVIIDPNLYTKLIKVKALNDSWLEGKRLPLYRLIYEFRERQCGDPRDKIYAMQGLMRDSMNDLIKPDYSNPVEEVFANVTRYFITSQHTFDVICAHKQKGRLQRLPSWAPDYTSFGKHEGLMPLTPISTQKSIYNASKSEAPIFQDLIKQPIIWNSLLTTGIIIDTIPKVVEPDDLERSSGSHSETKQETPATADPLFKIYEIFSKLSAVKQKVPNGEKPMVAFWSSHPHVSQELRIAVGSIRNAEPELKKKYLLELLTLMCGRVSLNRRCSLDGLEDLLTMSCFRSTEGDQALQTLHDSSAMEPSRRKPLSTEAGRRAMGPEDAQIGDVICVLIGCSVPVVLRLVPDQPGKFELVGECYLFGFMDGEALDLRDKGIYQAQDIVLI